MYVLVQELGSPSLFEALVHQAQQNITVHLLTQKNSSTNLPFHELLANGGKYQILKPEISPLHDVYPNYCIIDENRLIYGNYTWCHPSQVQSNQSILIAYANDSHQLKLIQDYLTHFKTLWEKLLHQQENILIPYAEILKSQVQALELECTVYETEIQEILTYYVNVAALCRIK